MLDDDDEDSHVAGAGIEGSLATNGGSADFSNSFAAGGQVNGGSSVGTDGLASSARGIVCCMSFVSGNT